jgi:hypothetical protein
VATRRHAARTSEEPASFPRHPDGARDRRPRHTGAYVPADPGGADEQAKRGMLGIAFGSSSRRVCRGPASATKCYNRQLRDLIIAGRAAEPRLA